MPHPRRGPGMPHVDAFLYALGRGGGTSMTEAGAFLMKIGHGLRQVKAARLALKRYGYLEGLGRNRYMVASDLVDVAPDYSLRVAAPGRPREPRLDLLLIVLSGDRRPRTTFTRLWARARNPGALYRRARGVLLEYGYIEDRYSDRHYYPGPRAAWILRAASGDGAVPPSPLQGM